MKHVTIFLLLGCLGCASMGRHTAVAGEKMGKTASGLTTTGVGVVLGVPIYLLAAPLYYGGKAAAGEPAEKDWYHL